jgi:hypothetical protein
MSERKETPDVLSEILGGDIAEPPTSISSSASKPASPKPKRARKTQTSQTGRRQVKSPTKWEYRLVTLQDYKGWRPRFIDGKALENWTEGPLMHEFIDHMGEDGWELVSACSGEKMYALNDKYQLYFKRPITG